MQDRSPFAKAGSCLAVVMLRKIISPHARLFTLTLMLAACGGSSSGPPDASLPPVDAGVADTTAAIPDAAPAIDATAVYHRDGGPDVVGTIRVYNDAVFA